MADDLAGFGRKIETIAKKLDTEQRKQRLERIGETASAIANQSLTADIGDHSLSHWRRKGGDPVDMTIGFKADVDGGTVEVRPNVRQAAGPWRVRESGRKSYAAGDRRNSGTYKSKKTGQVRQKTRKVKRNVAAAGGHQTWSKAVAEMAKQVPEVAHKDVQAILRSQFGG